MADQIEIGGDGDVDLIVTVRVPAGERRSVAFAMEGVRHGAATIAIREVRRRVAIITPSLGLGGAEQWIRCLVTHCTGIDWVVGVLSGDPYHPVIGDHVCSHASVHATSQLRSGVAVHRDAADVVLAATDGADAVIVWGGGDYFPLPTAAPSVFVAHGTCEWTRRAAQQAADGGVTRFVGVSEAATLNISDLGAVTIWNGVDAQRLAPGKPRDEVRASLLQCRYDYAKLVGYLGRLGNEKNVDGLIHAVASLPYHYQLVCIGCSGWSSDRILSLARTMLPGRLVEIGVTDQIGTLLSAMDCVVQVSPREGNSLAVAEAMMCGVPIVSTRTGAIPEFESAAGCQLITSVPDDPTSGEVAAAIRDACFRGRDARVAAAQSFARSHLTAEAMCRKWSDYLAAMASP